MVAQRKLAPVPEPEPEPEPLPEPAEPAQLGRVFGVSQEPVTLGGDVYHFARFPAVAVRKLYEYIGSGLFLPAAVLPGETLGAWYAEGVVLGAAWPALQDFFTRVLGDDTIPADLAERCTGDEIAACIDGFLSLSGLRYVERLLKNSLPVLLAGQEEAAQAQLVEYVQTQTKLSASAPEGAPTSPVKSSTSSTT